MGKESHAKHEPAVEEVKVKSAEEEIKASKNTSTDKDGTIYSCHFEVFKNDKGEVLFNGYNKAEILNPRLKGLNLYARLCNGRYKQDKKEIADERKGITKEAFEAFLDIIKCPVCLEVMQDPVNVKTCLHKFCNKCIEGYTRIEKKECPTCRTSIGSRRLLRKDNKLREIIDKLIPNLEDYQVYEQEEVQRNIKAISKSDRYKKQMQEIQKIKERQYRAEIEDRKDSKTQKSRFLQSNARRLEPKPRQFLAARPKEPIIDKKYRTIKRPKETEELKYDPNIKFKLKQLSSISSYPCNPKPGERIISKTIMETNDNLKLKHLTKYIKMKASCPDIESKIISFFVRGKNNRSKFDKITSMETSLKDLQEAYWPEEKMQTIYFMKHFSLTKEEYILNAKFDRNRIATAVGRERNINDKFKAISSNVFYSSSYKSKEENNAYQPNKSELKTDVTLKKRLSSSTFEKFRKRSRRSNKIKVCYR